MIKRGGRYTESLYPLQTPPRRNMVLMVSVTAVARDWELETDHDRADGARDTEEQHVHDHLRVLQHEREKRNAIRDTAEFLLCHSF